MSLKRLLYSSFLYLVFPLVLLRLLWRSLANTNYRRRIPERLGFTLKYSSGKNVFKSNIGAIWVHAVSVGEVIAAKPLINALLEKYPETQILITTTTPTGSDRVSDIYSKEITAEQILHTYFPYDLLGAVSRFISAFKPKILIVVETEIWPNLYAKCFQQKIPVLMVNARLSEKSTQSYLKINGLIRETLNKVNLIAVRSKIDADRFIQLGAKKEKIKEIGNIKYDIKVDKKQVDEADKLITILNRKKDIKVNNSRKILVAASTHQGESCTTTSRAL